MRTRKLALFTDFSSAPFSAKGAFLRLTEEKRNMEILPFCYSHAVSSQISFTALIGILTPRISEIARASESE